MTDTHFHFEHRFGDNPEEGAEVLAQMAKDNTFFGLDIGTRSDDIISRCQFIKDCIDLIDDPVSKHRAEKFIWFSAGIWPDQDSIENRFDEMKRLQESIEEFQEDDLFGNKLAAIGEGGIDHHWNPDGPDGHNYMGKDLIQAEHELFEMQLELAKSMDLPFIIHSRDGWQDTMDCIRNVGWNKGILHCCTYPLDQVKPFIDKGWYISFSGSVTYTKKNAMFDMEELLRYVPDDRILIETDTPYLAPVPLRGQPNSPVFVKHTYEFISARRGIPAHKLEKLVNENCKKLFGL